MSTKTLPTKTVATKKATRTKKPAAKKPAAKKPAAKKSATVARLRVTVTPRREIPDPEGEAIRAALGRLGFEQVSEVRAGRSFEIALAGVEAAAAADLVGEMCDQLLVDATAEEATVEPVDDGGGKS